MAGISLLMDLMRKNPSVNGQALHSTGLYSATIDATSAATYAATDTPFPSRSLYGFGGRRVAYCDAVATAPLLTKDYLTSLQAASETVFLRDTKEYDIQLKPLFSAFRFSPFVSTAFRCSLMFFLPLLESSLQDSSNVPLHDLVDEYQHVDYVVPLKMTVKQILLETSVVTTRRVLERLVVHNFSQRVAWKLIKDVPKSAVRKANRGMPFYMYFVRVCRTTFRGHFLGYAASWLVQVGIECYNFVRDISKKVDDIDVDAKHKRAKVLGERVYYVSVGCCLSLVSASIGAGMTATLFRPSFGQSTTKNTPRFDNHQMAGSTGGLISAAAVAASLPFAYRPLFGVEIGVKLQDHDISCSIAKGKQPGFVFGG
uniref:Uncharacterized protein n=1 Tax=Tanacetum cinerariifolium TaxID=118510 RepID=A0A6L2J2I6_TANCI|nr:hypothetical protein [Tanacetum cinerariifolium]